VNRWEDGHGRDVRQSREASRAEAARTDDLEKLAAEIAGAYEARLVTPEGRRPHLRVTNRGAPILREHIYAGPADGEAWWFWFGWAERIAPVADIAAAARRIEQVLRAVETR